MKGRIAFALVIAVVLPVALGAAGRAEEASAEGPSASTGGSFGVGVVDGLHLTGTPIHVRADEYRLAVSGLVERPLSLRLSEIKALPSIRRSAELVCPGVFRDFGVWTGVPLREVLGRAGLREGARSVAFSSIDGSYEQTLPLEKAISDGVYLAYEFNGTVFDPRNGFPLRLVAEGEPGSVWVKWLGAIEVRAQ